MKVKSNLLETHFDDGPPFHLPNEKVKVAPYTFVRRGVPVREEAYPEPSAFEAGWPVPFLAAFISPVGDVYVANLDGDFRQWCRRGGRRLPSCDLTGAQPP